MKLIHIAINEKNGHKAVENAEKAIDFIKDNSMQGFEGEVVEGLITGYCLQNNADLALGILEIHKDGLSPAQYNDNLYMIGNRFLILRNEFQALQVFAMIDKKNIHYREISDYLQSNIEILKYPDFEKLFCASQETYIDFIQTRLKLTDKYETEDNDIRTIILRKDSDIYIIFHTLKEVNSHIANEVNDTLSKILFSKNLNEIFVYHFHPISKIQNYYPQAQIISGKAFINAFTQPA